MLYKTVSKATLIGDQKARIGVETITMWLES
jgi:hypothetical protein